MDTRPSKPKSDEKEKEKKAVSSPEPTLDQKEEKFEKFSELPAAMQQLIAARSSRKDAASLAAVNKGSNALFQPQLSTDKLLQHVVRGEQKEAEAMLMQAKQEQESKGESSTLLSNLLTKKGTVTDFSNRTFEDITAFQYALWAKDRHMWKMLLKYLPQEEAARQLEQHEDKDTPPKYVTTHGEYYDFSIIKKALQDYVDYLNSPPVDWTTADQMWRENVGGAQRQVPAHVRNEYCRNDRSFVPLPLFKEDNLPRERSFYNWLTGTTDSWGPHSVNAGGGFDFAIYRGGSAASRRSTCALHLDGASIDLAAVSRLCEVRTEELAELKIQLLNPTPSVAP